MLYVPLIHLIPVGFLERTRYVQSLDSTLRFAHKPGDMYYVTLVS